MYAALYPCQCIIKFTKSVYIFMYFIIIGREGKGKRKIKSPRGRSRVQLFLILVDGKNIDCSKDYLSYLLIQ